MSLRITHVHARFVDHALRSDRVVISAAGQHNSSRYLAVCLENDQGMRGYGEAATTPIWSGESADTALLLTEQVFAPDIMREPWDHPADLLAALDRITVGHPFTKSAIDCAAWDLLARQQCRHVADLAGDRSMVASIPSRASIGAYPLEQTLQIAATFREAGIRTFKFKTGVTIDGVDDLTRLRAARDLLGPDVAFTVDYNGAFDDADAACRAIDKLLPLNLKLVEQPTHRDRLSLMAAVRKQMDVPILADEAIFSPAQLDEALALDAFDLLSIYPGKNGGFTHALSMAQKAAAAGKACAIGSNLETDLGMSAMATLAACCSAFPVDDLPCDLASSLYYQRSAITQPLSFAQGSMTPPDGPGFGVTPTVFAKPDSD